MPPRRSAVRPSFSLAQCNAMLPLVRAVSDEISERRQRRRKLLRSREELMQVATPEGLTNALSELDARIYEEEDAIHLACRELEDYGLTVLRVNPLVVHFPGHSKDQQLVFCWQEGDGTVSHGHPEGEEQEPRYPLKLRSPG